jgi:hypothetical protein
VSPTKPGASQNFIKLHAKAKEKQERKKNKIK